MARVDHELNLNVAFVKAGLITPAERKTARAPAIASWKAQPWSASGSAAIVLKDADDQETLTKVKRPADGTCGRSGERDRSNSGQKGDRADGGLTPSGLLGGHEAGLFDRVGDDGSANQGGARSRHTRLRAGTS